MSIAGLYVVRWALVAVFLALLAGCAVANDVSNIVVKDQAGNAITLAPSFSAGTLTGYSAITLGSATSLKVTATFGSGTATAKINSESPQSITTNSELSGLSISMGSNTLTIAHDGDGSYVITIIKPVVSALAVKDQAGNTISLSPAFAPPSTSAVGMEHATLLLTYALASMATAHSQTFLPSQNLPSAI